MGDTTPEPAFMAAPAEINHRKVVAAIRLPHADGEIADQYEVIAYDGPPHVRPEELDLSTARFAVWRAAFRRYDGFHGSWTASNGSFDLSWDRALRLLGDRSGTSTRLRIPRGKAMSDNTVYTADGVEIRAGLRVFTNNCRWGTVTGLPGPNDGGWFHVREDDHGTTLMNGGRCHTRDMITGSTDPDPQASP